MNGLRCAVALFMLVGSGAPPAMPQSSSRPQGPVRFVDTTAAAGIDFRHHHGGVGDKQLPETMGSGLAWLDYDRDGRWDLYLVDSGSLPGSLDAAARPPARAGERPPGANALYRGVDSGFVLAPSAGAADQGYGQGVSVADYDADGFPDIYVANFGRNALYRNNGDGTFSDVTERAGVGGVAWSVGSAWGDLDGDGLPELYVANYLEYDLANPLACGEPEAGVRSYCHISLFDGAADILYRNDGDGGFSDVTVEAGIAAAGAGKGLGVIIGHVDGDDLPDIYVANDTTQNFLFMNRGAMTFEEVGLVAGVGYGSDGRPQAGMGVELGDLDADGNVEIVVTNFDVEPANLFRVVAPGFYLDDSFPLGLGAPTLRTLGFGLGMADFDADGDLDIVIANGHILDDVEREKDSASYAQPNQLLRNGLAGLQGGGAGGGRPDRPERGLLSEATQRAGEALAGPRVSRGLAVADFDRDGLPDIAVSNSNDDAQLLRNDTDALGGRMVLRLRGGYGSRDAAGARVQVFPDGMAAGMATLGIRAVHNGSSYASQHAPDVYVGLGAARSANVTVIWHDGRRQQLGLLQAGALYLVREGAGVVAHESLPER